eukprot:TRINITY_DN1353_c0_g1_i1.p1 TRINITY_DN1353_c0_g1~~TRINITY_DN1353_c0_g1_i1.p1  ORF type:complete len:895 (-),score=219.04 TRINITY_DN1353_c0_g1_i1:56-2641(-)
MAKQQQSLLPSLLSPALPPLLPPAACSPLMQQQQQQQHAPRSPRSATFTMAKAAPASPPLGQAPMPVAARHAHRRSAGELLDQRVNALPPLFMHLGGRCFRTAPGKPPVEYLLDCEDVAGAGADASAGAGSPGSSSSSSGGRGGRRGKSQLLFAVLRDGESCAIEREVDVLLRVRGAKNVVQLEAHGTTTVGGKLKYALVFRGRPVCTLKDGLQFNSLNKSPQRLLQIFIEVCEAVADCHNRGIVHGHICPENILLQVHGLLLASFNCAFLASSGGATSPGQHQIPLSFYQAPELCSGSSTPSPAVDIYSLGCLLYRITTFNEPTRSTIGLEAPTNAMSQLVGEMTSFTPTSRPTLEEVLLVAKATAAAHLQQPQLQLQPLQLPQLPPSPQSPPQSPPQPPPLAIAHMPFSHSQTQPSPRARQRTRSPSPPPQVPPPSPRLRHSPVGSPQGGRHSPEPPSAITGSRGSRSMPALVLPEALPSSSKALKLLTNVLPKKLIGSGSFGQVWRGEWGTLPVAMKTSSLLDRTSLLLEATTLSMLSFPNIIQVYGVCEVDGTLYQVMELADGSVLDLVRTQALGLPLLLRMARDVASAMQYLAARGVCHRDLAARNVLWKRSDSPQCPITALVSDFGLALKAYKPLTPRQAEQPLLAPPPTMRKTPVTMPVRWAAIETLRDNVFTSKSDIWMWGVTLWELLSHGQQPYNGHSNEQILGLLEDGERLGMPEGCPPEAYACMTACWVEPPDARPPFDELCVRLTTIITAVEVTAAATRRPATASVADCTGGCEPGAPLPPPANSEGAELDLSLALTSSTSPHSVTSAFRSPRRGATPQLPPLSLPESSQGRLSNHDLLVALEANTYTS